MSRATVGNEERLSASGGSLAPLTSSESGLNWRVGEATSYPSFMKQVASRQLGSGYLFVGREGYLVDEAITTLRDALLTDDFSNFDALPREGEAVLVDEVLLRVMSAEPVKRQLVLAENDDQQARLIDARRTVESFDYAAYQGHEAPADKVLMAIRTSPFMARRRLVVMRQFDGYRKDDIAKLLAELSRSSKTCRLALTTETGNATLARQIAAAGCGKCVVELPETRPDDLSRLIASWAKQNRLMVDEDARQLLVECCGDSLTQLRSELDKIRTAMADDKNVTKDVVRDLAGHWREYSVNEFADAVAGRNRALALYNLRRLDEWNEQPVRIVAWLAGRFMRMLTYGGSGSWSRAEIGNSLRHLAAIDLKLKRGCPEPYYQLENFVIRRTVPARR